MKHFILIIMNVIIVERLGQMFGIACAMIDALRARLR
jgi:hypothetical protein